MNRLWPYSLFLCSATLAWATPGWCWGPAGHRIIGADALAMLDATARAEVVEILGSDSNDVIDEACSWPDTVRKTSDWEWSAPLHYVNIPRNAAHYDRSRDCPDDLCVIEGIGKYARELGNADITGEQRWQAFAWLCHLVGDLHQPLHAGYRDDRGGNHVEIKYRGESHNLHQFWDRVLINERLASGDDWDKPGQGCSGPKAGSNWDPASVSDWADESHDLVARFAYPPAAEIDEAFADQCWLVTRRQWVKAAKRLAQVLNSALGEVE